ncbi:MAG: hypothetical protein NZM31_10400 [Gemmatales bacterium]|nr:hypothetical protein [Gemmatales bacterium]MDW8387407.1 hypothetical protein [Gemmatales bacterium]
MSVPRVKVYGFLSLTKRQYLATLIGTLLLLVLLTPLWFFYGHHLVRDFLRAQAPSLAPAVEFVPFVVLAAILIEGIEAWIVLRKFARLEATESASGPTSAESTPKSLQAKARKQPRSERTR